MLESDHDHPAFLKEKLRFNKLKDVIKDVIKGCNKGCKKGLIKGCNKGRMFELLLILYQTLHCSLFYLK